MTSTRKQLRLQDGDNDELNVVVSATDGASITYDSERPMKFSASAFKFMQGGQTTEMDLFSKINDIENNIGNDTPDQGDQTSLSARINTATADLGTANTNLNNYNGQATGKFTANNDKIDEEIDDRGKALDALDDKFSMTNSGDDTVNPAKPPGLLYTLDSEIKTERDKIIEETKESENQDEKGDRQKAIESATQALNGSISTQQGRINGLENQLNNFFGTTDDNWKNLAYLIEQYQSTDMSLISTLAQSMSTLNRLRDVIDTTFPPITPVKFNIIMKSKNNNQYMAAYARGAGGNNTIEIQGHALFTYEKEFWGNPDNIDQNVEGDAVESQAPDEYVWEVELKTNGKYRLKNTETETVNLTDVVLDDLIIEFEGINTTSTSPTIYENVTIKNTSNEYLVGVDVPTGATSWGLVQWSSDPNIETNWRVIRKEIV